MINWRDRPSWNELGLLGGLGVDGIVAIAAQVRHPSRLTAIAHGHRHRPATRGHHMAERRDRDDRPQCRKKDTRVIDGKARQQDRAVRERLVGIPLNGA